MRTDKKELLAKLPPCNKCGLCKDIPYRFKRGEWECSSSIDRVAKKAEERDLQRLWALEDLWNVAFKTHCDHESFDDHDYTVSWMMKAEAMAKYVKKAKTILRTTDTKKIKELRQKLHDDYFGDKS